MANYFGALGTYVDSLANLDRAAVDAALVSVFRGIGKESDLADQAVTAYGWVALFAPYTRAQTYYVNTARLLTTIQKSGPALYTLSTFVDGGMDAANYSLLKRLNPKLAADYFRHSLMFAYENIGNPAIQPNITVEKDFEVLSGTPAAHSGETPVTWSNHSGETD